MTLTARPRFLIRFAALAALALCGIVLALSSTGTPPVGAQDGPVPAKPTGVVATATHDSVALAWDDPSDASITHYQIFRRDRDVHDTGEFVEIDSNTGSAATSYTDANVEPEGSYVYRVKAVNQHGASTWSNFVRADTPAAPDPADLAPSGLEVSLVENRVTLTWDAPASDAASVTGYEILRRRPNDGEAALTTLVADTGNAETGYTDDSANEPGVSYTYRVKALRDGEQSKVSNYARIDLPDDYAQDSSGSDEPTPTPEALAPSGLTAAVEDGGVALSWTAPAEDAGSVTGYEVLRAQGSAALTTLEADTGSTDTAYTDSGVTGDLDDYRYQVKALRGGDASQGSNVAGVLQSAHAGAIVPLADVTLISNVDQTAATGPAQVSATQSMAQGFTTGANTGGYTLGSVELAVSSFSGTASDITVSIYSESSDDPGTVVHTLTTPASISAAVTTFTAPSGTTLAAGTTYYVVISTTSSGISLSRTEATAEDTGGASGWSIADSRHFLGRSGWNTTTNPLRMRVNGAAGAAASTDATLSSLVLNDGTNDLTLTPNFASGTTSYMASVDNAVSQITVTPTKSDSDASVEYLDGNDAAISDADGAATGHQVALEVGENTIKVKVTAEDDATTDTYTVVVTRQAQTQPEIWSATVTPGAISSLVGWWDMDPDVGAITDKDFTYDSVTYSVMHIRVNSGGILQINVDQAFTATALANLVLDVDGSQFPLSNSTAAGADDSLLTWVSSGLSWTVGVDVAVKMLAQTGANSPATGAPTISGTPAVGELLTADISNIGDSDGIADADFEYQWIAFDGTTDSDISGATGETYRPLLAHLNQTIKVRVTFDDDEDNAESLTSAPTAAVTASTYGQVIWAATLTVEEETVAAGTFFGFSITSRGSLEPYVFTHDGNSTTVTGLQYLEGGTLRFTFTGNLGSADFNLYLDGAPFLIETPGTAFIFSDHGLTWTDEQEVEVRLTVNRPATGAPAITGKPEVGETLTAGISGIMDEDGVPADDQFAYQWISNDGTDDNDIDGATDSTYTLVDADEGKTIKVRVSFTDDAKFPESLTSAAVTVPVAAGETVLVSNMNQTTSGSANSILHDGAQAFTTGTNSFGYTLESVEISLTVGGSPFPAHTVSIWTESSNNPGSSLGTLTNPDPVVNGVNTYTATDGISLLAGTTYFIVVDNSPSAGDSGRIAVTGSDSEDSGAASGWSIGDGRVYRDHDSTGSWGIFNNSLKIRINGQVAPPEIPADSSLVPDGLGLGDQFRLIFLSSETRTAEATDIATYNAWVQGLAANGHADIQDHSSTFRVVGSTAAVDARDNTSTTYTSSDKGVAIYWLGGDKAADDYEDFYDETWDEEASMRDESGTAVTAPSSVFTGSNHDGTTTGRPLGTNVVTVGVPNSTIANDGPLSSDVFNASTGDSHLYALSGVFEVGAIEVPADWSLAPSGLQEGDQFRLLFISSAHRNASPSAIATYNTWIQDQAASGHTDIQDYSSSFRAVGSTEDMDARDNTYTTYTSSDKGVAIYWLGGNKVADDYEDFYDEDWDEEAAMKNESGTAETGVSAWTGSDHDGTEMLQGTPGTSRALGNSNNAWVRFGKTDSASHGPLSGETAARGGNKRIYGLSSVFEVVAANNPATGAPTITGTAQVGELLTADASNIGDPDGIAGATFSYQWIADDGTTDSDISGATGETYRPLLAHLDQTIKVRVSFTDDEGNPESLTSTATAAVAASTYGQVIWAATLTVETQGLVSGFWSSFLGSLDPRSFTYDGTEISVDRIRYDGNVMEYLYDNILGPGHFNLYLDGDPLLLTDPGTAFQHEWPYPGLTWTDGQEVEVRLTVNRAPTAGPTITGDVQVGGTLTADPSAIVDPDGIAIGATYTYQWVRVDGMSETNISGATASTYTLVADDGGKTIKVKVSYTDEANFVDTATSNATTKVATAPAPPTGVAITTEGNGELTVGWTAPTENGGSDITGYKVQWKSGAQSFGSSRQHTTADGAATSYTIPSLTNGTEYTVRVLAVNSVGDSAASNTDTGTPSTTPSAPTNVLASGNAELTVTWDAPDDGGSAITGYTVQWKSGTQNYNTTRQATVTTTTHTIPTLTNDTTYTLRVKATNANGDSGWTETTATPLSGPGVASVTVDQASITQTSADVAVTVANPQNAVQVVFVRYRVAGDAWPSAPNLFLATSGSGTAVTFTLSGLTGNTAYDVAASLDETFASGVKTAAFTTSPTKPGKTRSVDVTTSGNGTLFITWQAPDSDGGSAITGYKVQWKSGTQSFGGDPSREHTTGDSIPNYLITGLSNGTEYTVRVIAVNAVGDGPPSDTTTGTPVGPPDAPPNVQAGSGHQQLTVSWGAPNDGGSAITEYTLQWKSGTQNYNTTSRQATVTTTTHTIPSLANGTEYTVRVRATNALGDSVWSAEAKGTPREGPHVSLVKVKEPISCTVTFVSLEFVNLDTAIEYQAHLRFRAQGSSSWTVLSPQGFWSSGLPSGAGRGELNGPSPAFTLTDLAYETTYEVQAALDSGFVDGLATTTFSTPNLSEAGLTPLSPGDGTLGLRMTRPTSEGRVDGYLLQWKSGDEEYDDTDTSERQADVPGPGDREYTITGLDNGVEYTVRAMAYNDNGVGVPSSEVRGTPEAPPNSPARGAPTISGTAQVGETLTADTGGIEDDDGLADAVYSYQWLAGDADISGATGETYTPAYDDQGKVIRVRVSFIDDRDFEETLTSEPTEEVAEDPDAPTEPPNAPRTVRIVGDTNTSLTLTWDAPDGGTAVTEYRVQWLTQGEGFANARRDGREAVVDASARSHTITGLTMYGFYQVRVLAVNGAGESKGSNTAWGFPGLGEGQYGP